MNHNVLQQRQVKAYIILTSLVICGLASAIITAPKVIHIGIINFPFSNIVFSIFTYPIVDCICELWGKRVARQTIWLGLASQFLISIIIELSIITPHASFWQLQSAYETVLSSSTLVVVTSLFAFMISQLLDIIIYQYIKNISQGKQLWLRSNVSTYLGQIVDSCIFVVIVFHHSDHKFNILMGSIIVKITISLLMTPVIYLIVIAINRYLDLNTLAFKNEAEINQASSSIKI